MTREQRSCYTEMLAYLMAIIALGMFALILLTGCLSGHAQVGAGQTQVGADTPPGETPTTGPAPTAVTGQGASVATGEITGIAGTVNTGAGSQEASGEPSTAPTFRESTATTGTGVSVATREITGVSISTPIPLGAVILVGVSTLLVTGLAFATLVVVIWSMRAMCVRLAHWSHDREMKRLENGKGK